MAISKAELGKRLHDIREKKGRTQAEVAEAADLSITQMSRIENGARTIYLDRLAAISDYLGISIVDILAPAEITEHPAYGTQFDAIVASCTPERVEEILRVCRIMAEME
ncbi:MAG: helix-turn-helix transcriptional regulator [Clostridia bacterium]|nr:helix-turn-helix transcriptional regulator [Clostridia bacterium]